MIDRKISVHLQDYPDVSHLNQEEELVNDMDLVRNVCSTALAIRDDQNLRVRLPLAKLTLIGKNSARIIPFKEIIADEVNVKEISTKEDFSELAELKLQINFKKIGAKYGSKVKDIIAASKQGKWRKNNNNQIEICDITLSEDEFEIKLEAKNNNDKKYLAYALPTNDFLVELDIEITPELANEGIARDIIRAIQQNRKNAEFDISDKISVKIFCENDNIIKAATDFSNYIKEQVLAKDISFCQDKNAVTSAKLNFENKLETDSIFVALSL